MSKCVGCNQRLTKNRNGVECATCSNSFHLDCITPMISADLFNEIVKDAIQWNCADCKLNNPSNSVIGDETFDVKSLKQSLDKFSIDLDKLKSQQLGFNDSVNSLNVNFHMLLKSSEILVDHGKRIEALESANEKLLCELKSLRVKLQSTDDVSRMRNFLIHGVPVNNGENRLSILTSFITFLEVPSCVEHITRISRLRIRNQDSNIPPLIIECDTVSTKEKIIDAFKTKKIQLGRSVTLADIGANVSGDSTSIFPTDHLSISNQLILKKANELKTKLNYKFIWSQHGYVLCRKDEKSKIIKLDSIDVIEELLNVTS